MIEVTISLREAHLAADVGRLRHARNRGVNRDRYAAPGGHGATGEPRHVDGALAEYAVASWLGLADAWLGCAYADTSRPENPGVALLGARVRGTRWRNGELVLHREDDDALAYVLVIIVSDTCFQIAGWTRGAAGKAAGSWEKRGDGAACFYVPRYALTAV